MKKSRTPFLLLSFAAVSALHAEEISLGAIEVEEAVDTTIVKDVAGEEVRSADLAVALSKLDPDVQLIRRSGIANDIILRGLRKDDINFVIDGGKIYGGCPNRMDPPISHVLTSNVEKIVVKEGPYDVENFGTLGGVVKVETLEPRKGLHGEGYLNVGSWNYTKIGVRGSAADERFGLLVGASTESSRQYQDGESRTLAEQVDAYADTHPGVDAQRYAPMYKDMKAFEKKSAMVKLFAKVTERQRVEASYTANRSDDVLYPNSKMDARRDDSDLLNLKYTVTDLGRFSKRVDLEFYNSWVDHPMGTYYRNAAMMMGVFENIMFSRIYGGKIKNSMDLAEGTLTFGIDASKRRWEGHYASNGVPTGVSSIDNAVTKNGALFAEYRKSLGPLDLDMGVRYDSTTVGNDDAAVADNDYRAVSAYLFGTYNMREGLRIFGGVGKSSRVPDGKELYFQMKNGMYVGNPDLDQTVNYEADLGLETEGEAGTLKAKLFYSKLKKFIAYNFTAKKYENVDARLYGFSVGGSYVLGDTVYAEFGAAYQRGKKETPLAGQTDRDLPNVLPLKANAAINYDLDDTTTLRLSANAAAGWKDYDADNGEQKISGYTTFDFKLKKDLTDRLEAIAGIDNILDRTYTITNTYADMILTSGGGVPMLLNEPGRYYYCNLTYRF